MSPNSDKLTDEEASRFCVEQVRADEVQLGDRVWDGSRFWPVSNVGDGELVPGHLEVALSFGVEGGAEQISMLALEAGDPVLRLAARESVEPQQESREAMEAVLMGEREDLREERDALASGLGIRLNDAERDRVQAEARVTALEALRDAGNRRCKRLEAALREIADARNPTQWRRFAEGMQKVARAALDAAEREKNAE